MFITKCSHKYLQIVDKKIAANVFITSRWMHKILSPLYTTGFGNIRRKNLKFLHKLIIYTLKELKIFNALLKFKSASDDFDSGVNCIFGHTNILSWINNISNSATYIYAKKRLKIWKKHWFLNKILIIIYLLQFFFLLLF